MSDAVNEVLFGNMKRLRHTFRYSAQPVIERENVAEHSFWTAMIAMTIAYEVSPNNDPLARECAQKALLHDIEECMTGDLVREMKYATKQIRRVIKNVEETFVHHLLIPMGDIGSRFEGIWTFSKDDSPAGQIVKLADMLCVIAYCNQEKAMGNAELGVIRDECIKLIYDTFIDQSPLLDVAMEAIKRSGEEWSGYANQ